MSEQTHGSTSPTSQSSDAQFAAIVERAQSGDESGFVDLIHIYEGKIYGYISKLVGNIDVAEDLYSEFMVKVWKSLPNTDQGLRIPAAAKKWFFVVAHNLTQDYFKVINQLKTVSLDKIKEQFEDGETYSSSDWYAIEEVNTQDTEEFICDKETVRARQRIVSEGLKRISGRYRECFIMKDVQDYSHLEIAQKLNISESAARSYASRGRKMFIEEMARLTAQLEGGM
jgi:RNA polymerase sigma-70 factor, ECF subfamily